LCGRIVKCASRATFRPVRVLTVVLVAGLLAACGGKSPVTVGGCLNDAGFLVTSSGAKVEGTTPAGVAFTLTVYGSDAAATRAASKLHPRTTTVVATAVVDSSGNPEPGATVSAAELESIRHCVSTVTP
jgi:hypothetical protein